MSSGSTRSRPIWRAALADLWHEWPLNLCIILGIGALLFPVAVLYGLKHGAVSVLQSRLQNDPRSRELRPVASGFFSREWLQEWSQKAGVAFIVGLPRTVAATVEVRGPAGTSEAALIPTGAGDPLAQTGGLPVPKKNQAIISAELARAGNLTSGQRLELQIARRAQAGAWEKATLTLQVAGILPATALDYPALLVPPEVADAVEEYLDGLAVPAFGWEGEKAAARPAFTGVWVVAAAGENFEPETFQRHLLGQIGGTGLTGVVRQEVLPEAVAVLLSNANAAVEEVNLERLRQKLGPDRQIIPQVEIPGADLSIGDSSRRVTLHAWSPELAALGLAPAWPMEEEPTGWHGLSGGGQTKEIPAKLRLPAIAAPLTTPLQVLTLPELPRDDLWLPAEKAGLLRRAQLRAVEWQGGELVYTRRGYASFRLAAKSLPEVLRLREELEAAGIPVLAETQRIADIQLLETQLNRIFALFAGVAGLGAVTCLWAIAFSAAERKKRVLAFLQILGATRSQAGRFPLYQALWLSLGGAAVAWGAQAGFSAVVNALFAARLLPGERISDLPFSVLGPAVGLLVLVALSCYLVLLPRFIGLPLGEAAREP